MPITDQLSRNDVLVLIGHAEMERLDGMTESPRMWLEMARRIALAIGDDEAATRCVELASRASRP